MLAPRPPWWARTRTGLRLAARFVQVSCAVAFVAGLLMCVFGSSDDGLHCAGVFLAVIYSVPLVLAAQLVVVLTTRDERPTG